MGRYGNSIENLLAEYAFLLDEADFAQLGALFEGGDLLLSGGPADGRFASGPVEVQALYESIVRIDEPDIGPGTRHAISNLAVYDFAEPVHARCYFQVTQQLPGLPLQMVATGVYEDELHRVGLDWRFRHRLIVCDQVGDLARHMK